jgi:hypothetical protein
MLIYGWKTKTLKEAPFNGEACANCKGTERFIVVTASYAHIFWIPLFSYKKKLQIACKTCDHLASSKEISTEFKMLVKQLKAKVRIPWYFYSGLILFVLLIGLFKYQSIQQNAEYKSFLEAPLKDDIITLYDSKEPSSFKYYLWKVIDTEFDTIRISPNSFQYDRIPSKLDVEDGFYDFYYSFHKSYLIELFEDKSIKKVQRGIGFGNSFSREIPYPYDSLTTKDF